jgi:Flp pilus assembly protein TadG
MRRAFIRAWRWIGWDRFARNTRGAAALEFAMIALPLFTMILAVMELALVLLISISLEDAASTMARQIRVGTITAPGSSTTTSTTAAPNLAAFKQDLCNYILLVPSTACTNQIQVDIQPFSNFSGITLLSPISGQTFTSSGLCYGSGVPGQVVLMRVYYLWPLLTPFLLNGLENVTTYTNSSGSSGTGRWAAVSATEVFVNEPNPGFSGSGASC